jgi:hypothetical protein
LTSFGVSKAIEIKTDTMKKKSFPVGIQEFPDFTTRNYIYVDKTQLIHQLLTTGSCYFFARPRRFGKSLLLSTIREIFMGNKQYFKDLWIEKEWDWSDTRPVLHLSLASASYEESGLKEHLYLILSESAEKYQITLKSKGYVAQFKELLRKLHQTSGKKVVVLIDEYDKPLLDYLDEPRKMTELRKILGSFYSVLKDNQQDLHLIFLTGVSKFSKLSVFSELNHLDDISRNEQYAALAGYTQAELIHYFSGYLPPIAALHDMSIDTLLAEIKKYYNGYSWDGKNFVYNPFSILNFFHNSRFGNYWAHTGTPTFLSLLAKKMAFYDLDDVVAREASFDSFDMLHLKPLPLLYQAGYMTIKSYDYKSNMYHLGYPNEEVKNSFFDYLISAYSHEAPSEISPLVYRMSEAFEKRDLQFVMDAVDTLFANIPSHLFDAESESYYHSLMHLLLHYMGTYVQSEVNTSKGRMDSVIETKQYIYILEFKFNKSVEAAFDQMIARNYAQKYRLRHKEIIGVGVNFSSATKQIQDWNERIL